jgi:hypothetical protein
MKGDYPPFVDKDRLIALDQKWTAEQRSLLIEN